jgi:hypothetical protein
LVEGRREANPDYFPFCHMCMHPWGHKPGCDEEWALKLGLKEK